MLQRTALTTVSLCTITFCPVCLFVIC